MFNIEKRKIVIDNCKSIEIIGNLIIIQDENLNYNVYDQNLKEVSMQNKEKLLIKAYGLRTKRVTPHYREEAHIMEIEPKRFLILKSNDNNYGVYDLDGKNIVPQKCKTIEWDYAFIVKDVNNKWGIYDFNGRELISGFYDKIISIPELLVYGYKNGDITYYKLRMFGMFKKEFVSVLNFKFETWIGPIKQCDCKYGVINWKKFNTRIQKTFIIWNKNKNKKEMAITYDKVLGVNDEYINYCNSTNKVEVKNETNDLKKTLKKR